MRIVSGTTDQYIYFYAGDPADTSTPETGLTGFTVYYSRDGGVATAMTTPTVNETDATNMPGVYELLLDESGMTTLASGNDSEAVGLRISHTSMATIYGGYEVYRPKITAGNTLTVAADGDLAEVNTLTGHTAQTGDGYARLGAPAGASVSADIATADAVADAIKAKTDNLPADPAGVSDLPTAGAIAVAVEAAIINEGDGQQVIDAIVTAIGNTNVDTGVLVGLIRADLERAGGVMDQILADTGTDIPALLAALNDFDPATDTVAHVTLVDTTTTNTDMRGTDSAATAANLATVDSVVDAILVDTGATLPAQISALNNLSAAQVNTEVDTALADIHLDHLLAADYDPAAKPGVATALLNELVESDAGVSRLTANALEQTPSSSGGDATQAKQDAIIAALGTPAATIAAGIAALPTAAEIDSALSVAHGAGSWATADAGAVAYSITVTVTDGTAPLENAAIRVTEGAGSFVAVTDVDGQAVFSLDAATYLVSATKGGYSFTPATRTVTGNEAGTLTADIEMAAVAPVAPPADASMCRVTGFFEDGNGVPSVGVSIEFHLVVPANGAALSERMIAGRVVTATTDANGQLVDAAGNLYLDLQRNDLLLPVGTKWQVISPALGLRRVDLTLAFATYDMADLV
jgi:hypothetical protein